MKTTKFNLLYKKITLFLILVLFQNPLLAQEKSSKEEKTNIEIYEDNETGQLFTKPGPNRTKIKNLPASKKEHYEPYPTHLTNRPSNLMNEKLTITGRIQVHGMSGQTQSIFNNGHRDYNSVDWGIRRARLGFLYSGDKWWGAALNLRLENAFANPYLVNGGTGTACANATCTQTTSVVTSNPSLKDARGYMQEAFIFVNLPFHSRLNFGLIPVQFNRDYLMSSANFVGVERTYVTNVLPQFDNGVSFQISPLGDLIDKKYEKYLTITAMVSNGHGGGGDYGFGRRIDTTYPKSGTAPVIISPVFSGRIQYNVFGGLKNANGKDIGWQEGEEIFQDDLKWSIGAGVYQTKNHKVIGTAYPVEFQQRNMEAFQLTPYQATPDRGSSPWDFTQQDTRSGINMGRPNMGLVAHNYDTTFTFKRIYLNGAVSYFRGAGSNDIRSHHVTAGYNIPVFDKWIMPVVRYDFFKADFNRNRKIEPEEAIKQYWVGLNFFGDRHLFKAQLFFNVFKDKMGVNPYGERYDLNNNQVFFQLQATFWTGVTSPDKLETKLE